MFLRNYNWIFFSVILFSLFTVNIHFCFCQFAIHIFFFVFFFVPSMTEYRHQIYLHRPRRRSSLTTSHNSGRDCLRYFESHHPIKCNHCPAWNGCRVIRVTSDTANHGASFHPEVGFRSTGEQCLNLDVCRFFFLLFLSRFY